MAILTVILWAHLQISSHFPMEIPLRFSVAWKNSSSRLQLAPPFHRKYEYPNRSEPLRTAPSPLQTFSRGNCPNCAVPRVQVAVRTPEASTPIGARRVIGASGAHGPERGRWAPWEPPKVDGSRNQDSTKVFLNDLYDIYMSWMMAKLV